MDTFPKKEIVKENLDNQTVSDNIFGHRFHSDQTLYEYLIEFLLIFVSVKKFNGINKIGEMRFHNQGEELKYYAEPKMGLKRFIFYDRTKKDKSIPLDEDAYYLLINEIKQQLDDENSEKKVTAIQDLLRGYAVILKKRTWCAQQTLPLCPELIFNEAMPNQRKRLEKVKKYDTFDIDKYFQFKQRNFLAKGGEIYYMHLLQAFANDSNSQRKNQLENLLKKTLIEQSGNISKIARIIQNTWEGIIITDNKNTDLYEQYELSYIPENAYKKCGNYAVDELICYLSNDFQHIKKFEIMAKGVMFQIMRMMYCAVAVYLKIDQKPWIIDMTNNTSKTIKKIANNSYRSVEEDFKQAIDIAASNLSENDNILKNIKKGQKDSVDIFRSKGKELRCIIPVTGAYERFTLSEDVLRFLVISLIKPTEKITYEMFLERMYKHYNIVIGPIQYEKSLKNLNQSELSIKNSLYENEIYFQEFLKSTGFLKELSDSTSLVYNPYNSIE